MKDKELDLEILENADDSDIRRIAGNCPASESDKERMFAMSRKIYNERTKESNETPAMVVSGVEIYKKPLWQKIVSAAAVIALVAGGAAGGLAMLQKSRTGHTLLAQEGTLPAVTETENNYPFGKIDRVRMLCPAIAPAAIELESEDVKELVSILDEMPWKELKDKEPADGEISILHIYNNNDPYLLMVSMMDGSITYLKEADGITETKHYSINDKITQFLNSVELEPDKFLYAVDGASAKDNSSEIWNYEQQLDKTSSETVSIPPVADMQYELAKQQLRERGLNINTKKMADETVKPGYVIKSEPAAGEKIPKGSTVTLYVSSDSVDKVMEMYDFRGMNADDADVRAGYYGFNIHTTTVASAQKKGIIVAQSPLPGSGVAESKEVHFYISSGNASEGASEPVISIPDNASGKFNLDFIITRDNEDARIISGDEFSCPRTAEVNIPAEQFDDNSVVNVYITNSDTGVRAFLISFYCERIGDRNVISRTDSSNMEETFSLVSGK